MFYIRVPTSMRVLSICMFILKYVSRDTYTARYLITAPNNFLHVQTANCLFVLAKQYRTPINYHPIPHQAYLLEVFVATSGMHD